MKVAKIRPLLIFLCLPPILATVLYVIYVFSSRFQEPENFSWLFYLKEIFLFYVYLASIYSIDHSLTRKLNTSDRWIRESLTLLISLTLSLVISLLVYYGLKSYFIFYYDQNDQVNLHHLILRALSTIVGFTLIYSIYVSIRYYNKVMNDRLKEEMKERENIELKYKLLNSKLDPHFLFNNFNTLHSMIVEQDSKAEDFVVSLSRIMRYSFSMHEKLMVSLEEELEILKDYMNIMESRFPDSLHCVVIMDKVSNEQILPMTLLHLIENVVKHNEITVDNPIHIRVQKDKQGITVSNNVIKRDQQSSNLSYSGLKHLNEVYQLKFNLSIVVHKTDNHFSVKIPFI